MNIYSLCESILLCWGGKGAGDKLLHDGIWYNTMHESILALRLEENYGQMFVYKWVFILNVKLREPGILRNQI